MNYLRSPRPTGEIFIPNCQMIEFKGMVWHVISRQGKRAIGVIVNIICLRGIWVMRDSEGNIAEKGIAAILLWLNKVYLFLSYLIILYLYFASVLKVKFIIWHESGDRESTFNNNSCFEGHESQINFHDFNVNYDFWMILNKTFFWSCIIHVPFVILNFKT